MTRSLEGFRIALVTDTWMPQLNGVTRTLGRLVREARHRGANVVVHAPHDPAGHPDATLHTFPSRAFWAYPTLRMSWPRRQDLETLWSVWRPNLVHAATPFGVGLAARSAAAALGIPFVTSYHTSLSAYANFYGLSWLSRPGWSFLRWFHNSGLRTWVPTHAIADELRDRGFKHLGLWGRGVDPDAFSPAFRSWDFRRAHGIGDHEVVVAYVGRIAREKGIDVLLRELHEGHATSAVSARLLIVGDGPHESRCRAAAPAGTIFTGTLSGHELSAAFASADLFAFPSLTDTFGNVVLEAMASGVPVLAADCAVTRELGGDGAAFFFDPARAGSLSQLIREVLREPARLRAVGERGRSLALDRSWNAIFDGLFSDYHEAVTRHARLRHGRCENVSLTASASVVADL